MHWISQNSAAIFALLAAGIGYLNTKRIKELHVLVNSRLSELLTQTATASRAEGMAEGVQKERDSGRTA